ncbi:hypothetical protein [Flavobacterium sp. 3HN19-14]|uniref:hypothetical protein n=1 Tax=Flavobacterium sp. 3HN19-14 TaxID=3448133 RepID=UPI003EE0660A
MSAGASHAFRTRSTADNTCVSSVTNISVNAAPTAPSAPSGSVTTQPTCAVPTGHVTITAPLGAGFEYNVDGGTYQASTVFSGLSAGASHAFRTRSTTDNTCVSSVTNISVNAAPTAPSAPSGSVTTQPTCAVPTGTVTITAPLGAGFEYNVDGGTYQGIDRILGLVSWCIACLPHKEHRG